MQLIHHPTRCTFRYRLPAIISSPKCRANSQYSTTVFGHVIFGDHQMFSQMMFIDEKEVKIMFFALIVGVMQNPYLGILVVSLTFSDRL